MLACLACESVQHKMERVKEIPENLESIIAKSFLNLEKIDTDLYRSCHLWKQRSGRAVYGGQVVGQALVAASNSVSDDHHTHSLHCYFLRPGNVKLPILYSVDRTRDGNVYSSRSIKAMQEGQAIFTMQASFKTEETDPFQHQFAMPVVPPPDQCIDVSSYLNTSRSEQNFFGYKKSTDYDVPAILLRAVGGQTSSAAAPARSCVWIRTGGHLGDNYKMHQCCAAYMSDMFLLGTAIMPYYRNRQMPWKHFLTSIDHAMWFHSQFRADDWLLYETESPVCTEGRAYVSGRIWSQDGRLVMSVAQEGVVRTYKDKPKLDKAKL